MQAGGPVPMVTALHRGSCEAQPPGGVHVVPGGQQGVRGGHRCGGSPRVVRRHPHLLLRCLPGAEGTDSLHPAIQTRPQA